MINKLFVQCEKCGYYSQIEPAESVTISDKGVFVKHSNYFSTMYNGAVFQHDNLANIVLIPSCIYCK